LGPRQIRRERFAEFRLTARCCDTPRIALQSSVKNCQLPGSGSHRLLVEMPAMKIRITLIAAISFCLSIVRADEAIFVWTYTTDLLPRGRWGI
jgi:hypothetical protein